jgi:hypothetical protein
MKNKRGQGLSTGAIVLIILGIVVLVILILGFMLGWDKLLPFLKEDDNVDTIVQGCNTACSYGATGQYAYCSKERRLIAPDLPGDVEYKDASCHFFASDPEYAKYGIPECPDIDCT